MPRHWQSGDQLWFEGPASSGSATQQPGADMSDDRDHQVDPLAARQPIEVVEIFRGPWASSPVPDLTATSRSRGSLPVAELDEGALRGTASRAAKTSLNTTRVHPNGLFMKLF